MQINYSVPSGSVLFRPLTSVPRQDHKATLPCIQWFHERNDYPLICFVQIMWPYFQKLWRPNNATKLEPTIMLADTPLSHMSQFCIQCACVMYIRMCIVAIKCPPNWLLTMSYELTSHTSCGPKPGSKPVAITYELRVIFFITYKSNRIANEFH